MSNKQVCIICDRVFHKDQGVILTIAGRLLAFHSKSCALKFIKALLENVESEYLKTPLDKTLKQINERKKALKEKRVKKI